VTGVNEVWPAATRLFPRLERWVMTQVRGDVDVGATGTDGLELVVAGSPDHRHPRHHGIGRARHADPTGALREDLTQPLDKLAQRQRTGQGAHPPMAGHRVRVDLQGCDFDQSARIREGVTHAR